MPRTSWERSAAHTSSASGVSTTMVSRRPRVTTSRSPARTRVPADPTSRRGPDPTAPAGSPSLERARHERVAQGGPAAEVAPADVRAGASPRARRPTPAPSPRSRSRWLAAWRTQRRAPPARRPRRPAAWPGCRAPLPRAPPGWPRDARRRCRRSRRPASGPARSAAAASAVGFSTKRRTACAAGSGRRGAGNDVAVPGLRARSARCRASRAGGPAAPATRGGAREDVAERRPRRRTRWSAGRTTMTSSSARSMARRQGRSRPRCCGRLGSASTLAGGTSGSCSRTSSTWRRSTTTTTSGRPGEERAHAVERRAQEGPLAEQRQERLGPFGARERPEARAAAAGEDHGVHPGDSTGRGAGRCRGGPG